MNIGLAIMVKTPGHSPVKTRLAADIGSEAAETFHRLAAAAVAEVVADACTRAPALQAHWAVAEADAIDAALWRRFPRIAQGEGDLGARMRHVHETLRTRHGAALLIGADAPQLCSDDLLAAVAALHAHDRVIGPSVDGGFWLFGGRTAVADAAWETTPWSQSQTRARFLAALGATAPHALRSLQDVDTATDLAPLRAALDALPAPTPAQRALAAWLRDR
jgi:rSAM/selenodomain-associated transferase 1